MIKKWTNGKEEKEKIEGLSASFGSLFPTTIESAQRLPATFAEPVNGCSPSSLKVHSHFSSNYLYAIIFVDFLLLAVVFFLFAVSAG